MKPLEELLNDNVYAFASIRRAKSDVEMSGLHAIYFWWENDVLSIYFHLEHAPTRDDIDEMSSVFGEVSCDYEVDIVRHSWGLDKPQEKEDMVMWVIDLRPLSPSI